MWIKLERHTESQSGFFTGYLTFTVLAPTLLPALALVSKPVGGHGIFPLDTVSSLVHVSGFRNGDTRCVPTGLPVRHTFFAFPLYGTFTVKLS